MKNEDKADKIRKGIGWYIGLSLKWTGGIMILLIIGLVIFDRCDSEDSSKPKKVEKKWHDKDMSIDAYTYATMHFDRHVKSPRQTKHPWGGPRDCVTKIDSITYRVNCHADTPNSFGTMIRVRYTATVRLKEDGGGEIIDFNIID